MFGFGKTKFEKFAGKVLSWLKSHGVETELYIGQIMDMITDYFDEIDPAYAAQCIMFELKRGWTKSKAHGIRESVENIDDFVDAVLDELDSTGEYEAYNYYKNHRKDITQFIDENSDPISVARELANLYEANDSYNEEEERNRQEYIDEVGEDEDPEPDENFSSLRELHHCGKEMLGKPTGADGMAATPKDPIAYAISKNDIKTLENYYTNGIPLSLITGDSDDTERIPWDSQYNDEFGGDNWRLLTCNGHNINSALEFMLNHTPDDDNILFIVPTFDLYNLFVSKWSSDEVICRLAWNFYYMNGENKDSELSYFDIPLKSLLKYYDFI